MSDDQGKSRKDNGDKRSAKHPPTEHELFGSDSDEEAIDALGGMPAHPVQTEKPLHRNVRSSEAKTIAQYRLTIKKLDAILQQRCDSAYGAYKSECRRLIRERKECGKKFAKKYLSSLLEELNDVPTSSCKPPANPSRKPGNDPDPGAPGPSSTTHPIEPAM